MIEQEFLDGYFDGHDLGIPSPGANRTDAYKHSFGIARREANKEPPVPAHISRARAAKIESEYLS